ncbi:unnamed protein product, partial [marine sediment metagenome]
MAVRVDQDAIIKYADKVFLGLAVVFLIGAGAFQFLRSYDPEVTYGKVEQAYAAAERRMASAGDAESIDQLLEDDKGSLELLKTRPDYAQRFFERHQAHAGRWLVPGSDRFAFYKALEPLPVQAVIVMRIPSPDQRVAPTRLLLRADRRYRPSGNEKDGFLGTDLVFVTGQATVNLGQQTQLSRQ